MPNFQLFCGDSLDQLKNLPDNSVDSIVTDPPYGLSFMGKKWDYDVPSVDIWKECLRVLKPGGHVLAFAGTRTQHRMAVRIEDAGFEIRDMLAWVYGSGFPKSMDVSKAIDKMDASEAQLSRRHQFCDWMRSTGITQPQLRDIFHSMRTFSTKESCSTQASSYLYHAKQGPAVMPRYVMEVVRPYFSCPVPSWVEEMVDQRTVESENFKRREVVGTRVGVDTTKQSIASAVSAQGLEKSTTREFDITTAYTPDARQWEGWGTALKPALEPITLARKPLIGTVADNILRHGVGAINIDGCRVGDEALPEQKAGQAKLGTFERGEMTTPAPCGRFPANLIHDGNVPILGEASRFFYCAKASKKDRDEGLDNATQGSQGAKGNGLARVCASCGTPQPKAAECKCEVKDWVNPANRRNNHPTVKPTDLMRYLCRLITPPGGTVLDPFLGSGSTGKAAMLEGFDFIGVDLSQEYVDISRARIEHARNQVEEKARAEHSEKQKPKLF